jgi:hypothetical protein
VILAAEFTHSLRRINLQFPLTGRAKMSCH